MTTIFTRIIQGEIPGTFVYKDEACVAFMSINPMADGHVLVIPRDEVDHWVDLSPYIASHLFEVSHRISRALSIAFPCEKVGLIIAGLINLAVIFRNKKIETSLVAIWALIGIIVATDASSIKYTAGAIIVVLIVSIV